MRVEDFSAILMGLPLGKINYLMRICSHWTLKVKRGVIFRMHIPGSLTAISAIFSSPIFY